MIDERAIEMSIYLAFHYQNVQLITFKSKKMSFKSLLVIHQTLKKMFLYFV